VDEKNKTSRLERGGWFFHPRKLLDTDQLIDLGVLGAALHLNGIKLVAHYITLDQPIGIVTKKICIGLATSWSRLARLTLSPIAV
jgi:hypothetical protein